MVSQSLKSWLALWPAAVLAVLGLCLAVGTAYFGYRDARASARERMTSLRTEARVFAEKVESMLIEEIKEALVAADQADIPREPPTEEYRRDHPLVRTVVTLDDGVFYTWPRVPPRTVQLDRALAPPQYGIAEEEELSEGGDLEKAIELYNSCIPAPGEESEVPLPWQRLARRGIAACQRRLGRPRSALQQYNALLLTLPNSARYRPRPFDILMAKIDVLGKDLHRTEEAGKVALDLLGQINVGDVFIEDIFDARMLFDRIEKYATGEARTFQPDLDQLSRLLEEQRENTEDIEIAKASLLRTQFKSTADALAQNHPRVLFEPIESPRFGVAYLPVAKQGFQGGYRVIAATLSPKLVYNRLDFLLGTLHREFFTRFHIEPRSTESGVTRDEIAVPVGVAFSSWQLQPNDDEIARAEQWGGGQLATLIGVVAIMFVGLLGTVILMIVTIRRQLALAQLKSDFVANVSHELKTPLALIRLFGETLSAGRIRSAEKANEYYHIITRESERLTRLIDNILDFSKIESGQKRYEMAPCDVSSVVRQTVEDYRLQFEHDHAEHHLYVQPGLPNIRADGEAIAQVVLNLINNALKYSPGEKWVRVEVCRATVNGSADLCVIVEDHGSGIGPADREKLFDPFYRVESDEAKRVRGAGLGLAVVKHIVDAHQGRIEVESKPGQGSAFKLFFPIHDSGYADTGPA